MSNSIEMSLQKAESCFSAAHLLSSEFGKCHRLHGHLYTVKVEISGSLDEKKGVLLDFRELKELVKEQRHSTTNPTECRWFPIEKEPPLLLSDTSSPDSSFSSESFSSAVSARQRRTASSGSAGGTRG